MKIEGNLGRGKDQQEGMGGIGEQIKSNRGKYNQSTLFTCLKIMMKLTTLYN
jgi:hypothetical protein